MIQGCYDCQNKWMYLLPFFFTATISITLHSSSEQVLVSLCFHQCSSVLRSWLCIDDLIFFYCLLTQFFFLLDFGADSFCANSSKVVLFSANFAAACWRPKRDHCPDGCKFLQYILNRAGSVFLEDLSEARLESKLRENLPTDVTHPKNEDNWPTWRGLATTDSTASFCGFKKSLSFSLKKKRIFTDLLCYYCRFCQTRPVKTSISYQQNCNKFYIKHPSITKNL